MYVESARWTTASGWEPALPVPDARATLLLVFGSATFDDGDEVEAPLRELTSTWSDHVVIGCSTPTQLGPDDDPIRVVVIRFDRTTLHQCHLEVGRSGGARAAGREIATATSDEGLRGVLAIGDGIAINGTALAAGFAERLPGVAFAGGLAGDGIGITAAWTLVDGERRSGWVSAVGFVGEYLELGFGSAGGWDVFGPERLITQSYGNVLYELDGRPALPLYCDYLGHDPDALPDRSVAYPMAVRDLDDRTVVRTVWSVNPSTDSLRFAGDMPQGSTAQLLRASTEHLVEGAHQAARLAAIGDEQVALAISCAGRRIVLGDRADEELDAVLEAFDDGVRLVGFYSVGSLAPAIGGSELQNQAMTIMTMREHAAPVPT